MAKSGMLLVTPQIEAYRPERLVGRDRISKDQLVGGKGARGGSGGSSPLVLPISEDGTVEVGRLYDSTSGSDLKLYLPAYRVSEAAGRPEVRLELYEQATTVAGALRVGELFIALTWDPPAADGFTVQPMWHVASGYLSFQVPVEAAAEGMPGSVGLGVAETVGANRAELRFHFGSKNVFDLAWQALSDLSFANRLLVDSRAWVSHKTWRQVPVGSPDPSTQARALVTRGALITRTVNGATAAKLSGARMEGSTRRAAPTTDAAEDKRSKDTRYAVEAALLTSDTLKIDATTTVVSMAYLSVASPALVTSLSAYALAPTTVMPVYTATMMTIELPAATIARSDLTATVAPVATPAAETRAAPADIDTSAATSRSATERYSKVDSLKVSTALERVYAPDVTRSLSRSDLMIKRQAALPYTAAVDGQGEPASLTVEVKIGQVASTMFQFPNGVNNQVFVVPGEDYNPGTEHLLVPVPVNRMTSAGGLEVALMLYQDRATPDLYYYQPTSFRLARTEEAPHLPDMGIVFYNPVSEDSASGEYLLHMRVILPYRLVPHVAADVLDLALAQLGGAPTFTPLRPVSATLELDLPVEGQSDPVASARPDADVDFVSGIVDTLDLSYQEFTSLVATLQATGAAARLGRVSAKLYDGTEVKIDVDMSLAHAAGELFDVNFAGVVQGWPDRFEVRLHNRIESPVRIDAVRDVRLGAAVAMPVVPAPGTVLGPGASLSLHYDVSPAGSVVTDLPPRVDPTVQVDGKRLFDLLMVTPGFGADTFDVTVSIDPGFFGPPPPGVSPILSVVVDFEGGPSVNLNTSVSSATATLVKPVLDQLFDHVTSERYRFRFTLVHAEGEGARSGWTEGEGTVVIDPAPLLGV